MSATAPAAPAHETPPQVAVLQMLAGRWIASAIGTAARFKIADRLAARPCSAHELAPVVGAHAPSLYRLLRALASVGIVAERDDGRFVNTALGEALRSDVPGTVYGYARFLATEEHGAAWNALPYAVASGECAFEHVYGRGAWEHFDDDAQLSALFDDAMTSLIGMSIPGIVEHLDLEGVRTVADIGGSMGPLVAALLERHRGLRGIVFDRPLVVERARREASGVLRERCEFVAGDFRERVPSADVLLLSRIVHDWADPDAERILRACRAALPAHGRLVVVDCVIEPGNDADFGKLLDLEMLVMVTGRERTRAEFERLFERAGLRLSRAVPIGPATLLETVPA